MKIGNMNDEKDVTTENWWSKKCALISKYVLSYWFYIHLVVLISLSIVQLRFSIVYDGNCTIDDRIVLYLLLVGIFQIIYFSNGLLLIILCLSYNKYSCLIRFLCIDFFIHHILLVFLFIWFIVGNYLVFHVRNTVQYANSYNASTYCHFTLYQTAFWLTITYYILIILFSLAFLFTHRDSLIKQWKSSTNKI